MAKSGAPRLKAFRVKAKKRTGLIETVQKNSLLNIALSLMSFLLITASGVAVTSIPEVINAIPILSKILSIFSNIFINEIVARAVLAICGALISGVASLPVSIISILSANLLIMALNKSQAYDEESALLAAVAPDYRTAKISTTKSIEKYIQDCRNILKLLEGSNSYLALENAAQQFAQLQEELETTQRSFLQREDKFLRTDDPISGSLTLAEFIDVIKSTLNSIQIAKASEVRQLTKPAPVSSLSTATSTESAAVVAITTFGDPNRELSSTSKANDFITAKTREEYIQDCRDILALLAEKNPDIDNAARLYAELEKMRLAELDKLKKGEISFLRSIDKFPRIVDDPISGYLTFAEFIDTTKSALNAAKMVRASRLEKPAGLSLTASNNTVSVSAAAAPTLAAPGGNTGTSARKSIVPLPPHMHFGLSKRPSSITLPTAGSGAVDTSGSITASAPGVSR